MVSRSTVSRSSASPVSASAGPSCFTASLLRAVVRIQDPALGTSTRHHADADRVGITSESSGLAARRIAHELLAVLPQSCRPGLRDWTAGRRRSPDLRCVSVKSVADPLPVGSMLATQGRRWSRVVELEGSRLRRRCCPTRQHLLAKADRGERTFTVMALAALHLLSIRRPGRPGLGAQPESRHGPPAASPPSASSAPACQDRFSRRGPGPERCPEDAHAVGRAELRGCAVTPLLPSGSDENPTRPARTPGDL
ncbi:hypothetical protein BJ971_007834 [Actinoplanes digitatis]|uniref:Uncharacterized protein n=1 Tax=Actinoplanes digitatis TaxID=1868 RepID=A0A7W7I6G8_9ACTN|nr:hypothetical protein [Actinoplanes digitatis]